MGKKNDFGQKQTGRFTVYSVGIQSGCDSARKWREKINMEANREDSNHLRVEGGQHGGSTQFVGRSLFTLSMIRNPKQWAR